MRIELMSLDTAGGKAVVRTADRWYLLLRSREWRPVDIGGRERALAPHFSWPVTPIRRSFETFEELIDLVRRLCGGRDGGPPEELAEEAPDPWEEKLVEVIHRYGGLLDRTFEARGCTADESLRLAVETLGWLRDIGPVEDEDIPWLLFRLAREAHLGGQGDAVETEEPISDLRFEGETRLRKVLLSLDRRALQCLVLWGEPDLGLPEISKLLRMPPEDLRTRLSVVALRLGRPVEALRSPEVRDLCRALLRD